MTAPCEVTTDDDDTVSNDMFASHSLLSSLSLCQSVRSLLNKYETYVHYIYADSQLVTAACLAAAVGPLPDNTLAAVSNDTLLYRRPADRRPLHRLLITHSPGCAYNSSRLSILITITLATATTSSAAAGRLAADCVRTA